MNIREYYQKTAQACLTVAWISLLLGILFFICHLLQWFSKELLTLEVPLIVFSVIHFLFFRVYQNRVEKLGNEPFETSDQLFSAKNILVAFMPAPTLRILFFDSNGLLLGEIRDQNMRWFMWLIPNFLSLLLPKRFELINSNGDVKARYEMSGGLSNSVRIYNTDFHLIGEYKESWKKSLFKINGILYKSNRSMWAKVQASGSLYSFQLNTLENQRVASFQEGWMPIEWEKKFEINTPIISFSSIINEDERKVVFGFIAAVLHHRDN